MKIKNKIKYIYSFFGCFIILLLVWILVEKLYGTGGGYLHIPSQPLTWSEIIQDLPKSIILSLIISIVFSSIVIKADKINMRYEVKNYKNNSLRLQNCSPPEYHNCRICGYSNEDFPWGEDGKSPTFQICPCCGVQFGVGDITSADIQQYRTEWAKHNYKWFEPDKKPSDWSLEEQMKNIPKISTCGENE